MCKRMEICFRVAEERKWWVRKTPRQAHRISFLSSDYRPTLENDLHFSMDRNAIEIVKESYLEDKFHYSS
jgi:hypothetical protein